MVLSENALGGGAWEAMGYWPQDDWQRWVRFACAGLLTRVA